MSALLWLCVSFFVGTAVLALMERIAGLFPRVSRFVVLSVGTVAVIAFVTFGLWASIHGMSGEGCGGVGQDSIADCHGR